MIICFILMTFIADLRLIMLGEIGSQSLLEVNGLKPANRCSLKVSQLVRVIVLFCSCCCCCCCHCTFYCLMFMPFFCCRYDQMLQCWQEDPFRRPTFGAIASWTETLAYYPWKQEWRSFQCALIGAIRKMIYDCSSELDLESQAKK